ncbi:MAG: hypothetical protein Q8N08_05455 [Methanobacteriaceae archaeon]|nr:hypothetical protein [Methanobacteriaceae archaeon]
MMPLNMTEKAMIFNYILLTNQLVLELEDVMEGKKLTEQQTEQQSELLEEGANLLSRIIEGATLVEGKEFKNGLVPTMEGLSIYGYALTTIRKLDLIKEIKGFTEFFEKLNAEMHKLIQHRKKDEADISLLKNFFLALCSSLRGDIQKESYPREKTLPLNRKKQMNEYSYA